ncbi:gluconokinase, GntK/IdnK-type [Budvicia aquatica]|uniref:Gluconokinase n=2 Tax=Budvicia aquatica TaxID=82979 RepID=A0A2C6BW45_9GAMM|nr:gluconokinase, GntK/IdnK-type [Budvicia aquatica]PHI28360.1 gluconokinase [Budvicia aquatica]
MSNFVYILMGVSGSGKTTIAKELLKKHDIPYIDGDYLHPKSNILKMSSGQPLDDKDREPWLGLINNAVFAMQKTNPSSIIICSSLKKKYRNMIRDSNDNLIFLFLEADFECIYKRLKARTGHFQKPQMLISQFEALEIPSEDENDVYFIDANQNIDDIVNSIKNICLERSS